MDMNKNCYYILLSFFISETLHYYIWFRNKVYFALCKSLHKKKISSIS